MKVLRVKDKSKWKSIKRGLDVIIPGIDNKGEWVIPFTVLDDPTYQDLVEEILDQCDVIEYEPLIAPDDAIIETSIKQPKGDFSRIKQGKSIEEAVEEYYNSKKGTVTKVLEFFGL